MFYKIFFAFVLFISILLTYSYQNFSTNTSIGVGHAYTAISLAKSYNFDVNESWGNAGVDVITWNNNKYLPYAPFNSILMGISYFLFQIPIFFWVKIFGPLNGNFSIFYESIALSLLHSLALVVILFLAHQNTKEVPIKKGIKLTALSGLALGTLLLPYSVSFFNHIIAAVFVLGSFSALSSLKGDRKYLVSGTLTGLAFLTEYPTILFSIAVLVFFVTDYLEKQKTKSLQGFINAYYKKFILYSIPVSVAIFIQLIYNKTLFGGYMRFGEFIFKDMRIATNGEVFGFNQNPIFGIYGMYISPLKGLFFYSPFLLFSFLGIKKIYRKNKQKSFVIFTYILVISIFYSFWNDCFGATSVGTRYTVSIIPFVGILAIYGLGGVRNKFLKAIFTVLVVYSCITTIASNIGGIAWGKFGECKYINSPAQIIRTKGHLKNLVNGETQKLAPAILQVFSK